MNTFKPSITELVPESIPPISFTEKKRDPRIGTVCLTKRETEAVVAAMQFSENELEPGGVSIEPKDNMYLMWEQKYNRKLLESEKIEIKFNLIELIDFLNEADRKK